MNDPDTITLYYCTTAQNHINIIERGIIPAGNGQRGGRTVNVVTFNAIHPNYARFSNDILTHFIEIEFPRNHPNLENCMDINANAWTHHGDVNLENFNNWEEGIIYPA